MNVSPRCSLIVSWRFVLLIPATMLLGCGDPPTYPVSGTVTLDGKPLADASVSFVHTKDAKQSAVATTDATGRYELKMVQATEGMLPGEYEVRISTYSDANLDAEPPIMEVPERVPPKYNLDSELRANVKADQPNTFDFDLKTR